MPLDNQNDLLRQQFESFRNNDQQAGSMIDPDTGIGWYRTMLANGSDLISYDPNTQYIVDGSKGSVICDLKYTCDYN